MNVLPSKCSGDRCDVIVKYMYNNFPQSAVGASHSQGSSKSWDRRGSLMITWQELSWDTGNDVGEMQDLQHPRHCHKTRVQGMCCCCWSDGDWRTILNNIIISFVFIRSSWSLINLTWWELDPVYVLWKQPTPPKSATLRNLEMRYLGIVTVFKLPGDVWTLMIQLTKKSLYFYQQFLSSWKPLFSVRRLL